MVKLCLVLFVVLLSHGSMLEKFEVTTVENSALETSGRRDLFISIGGGDDECLRFDTWQITASGNLNQMAESNVPPAHTYGIKVDDTTHGATTCDVMLGVFTAGGGFGCVIEGGVSFNAINYCDSYPDIPVYAFNHNVRRWGTFVAIEQGCTDALHVNRFYMKSSATEAYWTYNMWVGKTENNQVIHSVWMIDSTADTGYTMNMSWAYIPPVYEWYAESFEACSTNCNYEGGIITRHVICRANKPKVAGMATEGNHNYINWDGSRCANLNKPATYQTCPAGSCMWVDYATNWNCMGQGTTVSNQETIQPNAEACQQSCANYSYAALWTHPNKLKCRCYHVCSSGGSTNGGVYATSVWEQVASGRRKN